MSCVAPGCTSGYGTQSQLPPGVTSHRFPKDPVQREIWIRAVPRKDWVPSASARICSLHFHECDYITERNDSKNRRDAELVRKRLKPNSVPHVFINCPVYLSKPSVQERSSKSSIESRTKNEIQRAEKQAKDFLDLDLIEVFEDILNVPEWSFPSSWNIISFRSTQKIVFEEMSFNEDHKPFLSYSLTISDKLSFLLVSNDVILPNKIVDHITHSHTLERQSDVHNLLAFLKSYNQDQNQSKSNDTILFCVKKLKEITEERETVSDEAHKKISFLVEQLELAATPLCSRKYSPTLLCTAITWSKMSSSFYRQLLSDSCLSLPSTSHLKRISSSFNLETGLSESNLAYLRERIKTLSDKEKLVKLIIDEVFLKFLTCIDGSRAVVV